MECYVEFENKIIAKKCILLSFDLSVYYFTEL